MTVVLCFNQYNSISLKKKSIPLACSFETPGGLRKINDSLLLTPSLHKLPPSLDELVDGTGCSSSMSSFSAFCFLGDVDCNQLTSHEGCGNNPVTESVTRLKIDYEEKPDTKVTLLFYKIKTVTYYLTFGLS